jgi:ATP-dependent helicase/nuclease subunit A
MQHLPLLQGLDSDSIHATIQGMVEREQLTSAQAEAVDPNVIRSFVGSGLGERLLRSANVRREIPFSCGLPAAVVYPEAAGTLAAEETILIQGVIDCIFEGDDGGLVLLDYKTDSIQPDRPGYTLDDVSSRYKLQMNLYADAIASIWKRPVSEKYLFFFDGAHVVKMG